MMAGRDKSFTINIIPHDANRRRREWIFSGRKLVLFRVLSVLLVLAVLGASAVLLLGAGEFSRNAELERRNRALSDSLEASLNMNRRLDAIEEELQQIRDTREVIENLATSGAQDEGSE